MLITVIIAIFLLSCTGIAIYRKTILASFPHLIKKNHDGIFVTQGAGGVLWDISFLFFLYLYWYENIPLKFLVFFLGSTFCFTGIGMIEDMSKLNFRTKMFMEDLAAVFSVIFYFNVNEMPLTVKEFFILTVLFLIVIYGIKYLDSINGSVSCITFIILLSFFILFNRNHLLIQSYISLFFLVSVSAFIFFNVYKKNTSPGHSGVYFFSSILFLLGLELFYRVNVTYNPVPALILLFSVISLNFLYMVFLFFRFKGLKFREGSDDFKLVPYKAHRKSLMILCCFQLLLSIIASII